MAAIEFAQSMEMSEEQIIEHIVKKFGLSEEEVREKIMEITEK